jgi:nucleotide-binding universal stress UspA family protein
MFVTWMRGYDLRWRSGADIRQLGCGTALPSLAILQRHLQKGGEKKLELGFADYNPSVLRLVTVPNILLAWAALRPTPDGEEPFEEEGELDIDEELVAEFTASLEKQGITLSFFSGAWGTEFATLVEEAPRDTSAELLVLAAETIYSPAALESFAEVLMRILGTEKGGEAMVGAKKVYFGVGGSMEDFCVKVEGLGGAVERIREEEDGVRREVVMVRTKE